MPGNLIQKEDHLPDSERCNLAWRQFNQGNTFFILGMGRSGTNFLAKLLGRSKSKRSLLDILRRRHPNALMYHEPFNEDFSALVDAHESYDNALRYLTDLRMERMLELIQGHDFRHYGEANSNLRFHAKAIKEVLPEARMLHLVRDGREVVRSVMERLHYTEESTGHHNLQPLPSDPLYQRWDTLSRFEKVCWMWADANRRLSDDIANWVSFELLISDYDYFNANLLRYLGLKMSEERWKRIVGAPTNITRQFTFPPWQEWDEAQLMAFDNICGEQMARYGYASASASAD